MFEIIFKHILKLFLKIICNRIYKNCQKYMSLEQFCFRSGFGTREASESFIVLMQKCWDQQKMPMYISLAMPAWKKSGSSKL